MQINTAIPNGNGTDYWLYAGPMAGTSQIAGMEWDATVSSPNALFASGSLTLVQVVIPDTSFTADNFLGIPSTYTWSENGKEELDTVYPYPWTRRAPNYQSNDSPGLNLTAEKALSAHVGDQFEDYLMYFAPGSTQCVPLARFVWTLSGNATIPASGWAKYGAGSAGAVSPSGTATPFGPSNSFPEWTQTTATSNGHF